MESDHILIRDLKLETLIGVYAWEKTLPQTVLLDLDIGMVSGKVFESGLLEDALDYSQVVKRLRALAEKHDHLLLERFAEAVAQIVLEEFQAPWVRVRVRKPALFPGVKEIGVEITRGQGSEVRNQGSEKRLTRRRETAKKKGVIASEAKQSSQ
ncbi:MAG: dihydroneopterin aldolase [Burkholderiales bacterium]|jgi:dihydroneopterin aldolase|nr:dihydroneopterin aldolase [Burkholderiales bacterium]